MQAVVSTFTLTRRDKSVPFFYNKKVFDPKYTEEGQEARKRGEILSIEFNKSKDELTLVLVIRYRSDKDRSILLERVRELDQKRKEYCDIHGHTYEINHYV